MAVFLLGKKGEIELCYDNYHLKSSIGRIYIGESHRAITADDIFMALALVEDLIDTHGVSSVDCDIADGLVTLRP